MFLPTNEANGTGGPPMVTVQRRLEAIEPASPAVPFGLRVGTGLLPPTWSKNPNVRGNGRHEPPVDTANKASIRHIRLNPNRIRLSKAEPSRTPSDTIPTGIRRLEEASGRPDFCLSPFLPPHRRQF
jgi:hypothetical protein